ncbi:MAG: ketol-acid reductoisomerase [Candidatus Bathyarchaeia archaeon]
MKIYRDEDADLSAITNKTIAVIGYGSQGRAQANNMKDSGLNVVIGAAPRDLHSDWNSAEKDGFKVLTIEEATMTGDIVHLLLPDPVQPKIYREKIHQNLRKGTTLGFSHGFNVLYGLIKPPEYCDVIAVVPEAPGPFIREQYLKGNGFLGTIAVERDFTGNAHKTALAMAKAIGLTRVGVLESTFREETEADNYVEQVCIGGLVALLKAAYEQMIEGGFQPAQAYMKSVQELKAIMDSIYEHGFEYTWLAGSDTCEYAGRTRGSKVINRDEIRKIFHETQDGFFAKDWLVEFQAGMPLMNRLARAGSDSEIEKAGKQLRELLGIREN